MMTMPMTKLSLEVNRAISSSLVPQYFVLKNQEWEEEITFLHQECRFFHQLLQQAESCTPFKERKPIQDLRDGFQKFERTFLEPFMEDVRYQKEALQLAEGIEYSSAIPNNIHQINQKLKEHFLPIKAAFKSLKIKAFELVKDFIDVKIW